MKSKKETSLMIVNKDRFNIAIQNDKLYMSYHGVDVKISAKNLIRLYKKIKKQVKEE